jgi:VanZ family protein
LHCWRWLAWWLLLTAWTVALLTPQPAQLAQAVLTEQLDFLSSKALHISAYALLVGLAGWFELSGRMWWLLLPFLSLHAAATEYLQNFIPERTASWRDVGLDHVGMALGLLLCLSLKQLQKRCQEPFSAKKGS